MALKNNWLQKKLLDILYRNFCQILKMPAKVISSGQNYFSVMLSYKQILTKIYFGVSATLQPNPIDIGVGGGVYWSILRVGMCVITIPYNQPGGGGGGEGTDLYWGWVCAWSQYLMTNPGGGEGTDLYWGWVCVWSQYFITNPGGGGGVLTYIEAGYVCDHNTL